MRGWILGIRSLGDALTWPIQSISCQNLLEHGKPTIAMTRAGSGLKLKAYDGGSRTVEPLFEAVTAARIFLKYLDSNIIPISPANQNLKPSVSP